VGRSRAAWDPPRRLGRRAPGGATASIRQMPTDTHYELAVHHLDKAAKRAQNTGDATPVEIIAQIGVGYAVLALMDEVEKASVSRAENPSG
jgi:hypothetical protein